ncbi:hypothetical protein Br6_05020 [Rhodococcus sp. Br-6]|nr:hypothetical protein Br6_05020 [Rhodococcus sp. Br-6]
MEVGLDARWQQGWWVATTADGEEHRARTVEQLLVAIEEHYRGSACDISIVLTVRYQPDPDWPLGSRGVGLADAMKVVEETPVDEASWIRELEEERARASNAVVDPWAFRYAQTPNEAEDGRWHWEIDEAFTAPHGDEPIRLWVDDLRPAPDRWLHVTTSAQAISVLRTGRVVELSLDHDLGGDETAVPVVDWMAEHGVWPAIVRVHTDNPAGRNRLKGTIIRYHPTDGYRGL